MLVVPGREDTVVRNLLERHAREQPDSVFVRYHDGEEWTFSFALEQARNAAAGLAELGVQQGDHVFAWMPNGAPSVRAWLGVNYLGAVFVPANTAYRGGLLEHVLELSDARVGVVHADLAPRLNDVELGPLKDVVIVGEPPKGLTRLRIHPASVLESNAQPPALARPIEAWDPMVIIFTSGTTGPSKGVLCSYAHVWQSYFDGKPAKTGRHQVPLSNLPLFHTGGLGCVYGQLTHGGKVVVVPSFKTDEFWDTIHTHGITSITLLGSMASFLLSRPPSPDDRNHTVRTATAAPYSQQALEFGKRYGVDVCPSYGMTELGGPIVGVFNSPKLGACGRARPGHIIRLVDDNDVEVPVGEVGEAVIRSELPWMMFTEYYKDPEATAKSWRNGWFHTGDLLRMDEDGDYYFVDRKKDALRRRGENISAFEVEREVRSHPTVLEVAVVAAKSDTAEDEVLACVQPAPGAQIDPAALTEYLAGRLPHFMVPRYLRVLPEFPRTPTEKIQKFVLRAEGVTGDTWDREAAGIYLKQQNFR